MHFIVVLVQTTLTYPTTTQRLHAPPNVVAYTGRVDQEVCGFGE